MLALLATIVLASAAETTPPSVSYRSTPLYPRVARDLPLPPVHCEATLQLDAAGEPLAVAISGCPDLFAERARRDLASWRFDPARGAAGPVGGELQVELSYRLREEPLAPPDPAAWRWTDRFLSRQHHLDRTRAWASVGALLVGMTAVGLASGTDLPRGYRERYLTAGFGLSLSVLAAISAQHHFDSASGHRRQRALWRHYRPR